ncbi:efflux RND transporter periplasmic adaptor subunit [Psychroflexus montanilacus]|uniref:efflux RND transporter periplasmic adaptor subunit n=1 Tax=Psychroflexus montanilacus TaxID=2873598 RepID=UPI001CCE0C44|nr:efflux RND transporter periplasmic adaptor subunit [Psychroflexus montanilacus]MBZ9651209.1 efflux RND transporter periplasmic adaptor subunit [Psychroflexus montanilacus]
MKTPYIYFLLGLSLLVLSCNSNESNSEEKETEVDDDQIILTTTQFENGGFELGTIDTIEFSDRFRITGMIDVPPENRASISSFFEGYVSKTHLLIGDTVKKGDLLVTLENPEFIQLQQRYLQDVTQLEYLEAEFNRKKNLFKDQVISEKVFQKAKSDYRGVKASVAGLEETLKLMNVPLNKVKSGNFNSEIHIYAPLSGKISKLSISQGLFVSKSTMMMEILDTDHIHLELDVFEKDILKIKKGQSLSFRLPEQTDEEFMAEVKLVGAEIGSNRTVKVHAHPDDEDQNFAVGMYVEAFVDHDPKKLMALPETAFVEKNDKSYVLNLVDQTEERYIFDMLQVETSAPQNGFKPILNTKTITSKHSFLTKGAFDVVESEGGGGHSH